MKKHDWNLRTVPKEEFPDLEDNRPTILFAGIIAPMYDGRFMADGFRDAGYNVELLNWQNIRFEEGVEGLHSRLIHKAESCRPDLIFLHIQNADVLTIDTCQALSKIAYTVLYTFDVRPSIDWQKALAPYLDLVLFGDYDSIRECLKEGIENVDYLASSANYMWYRKLPSPPDKSDYPEIVFIGSNYTNTRMSFPEAEQRVQMVDFMKKQFGSRFGVYGMNWPGSRILHAQDEINCYNTAKIAITQNQFYRQGYQSDRTYRSMGCGCFTVAQYYPDINKDFNSGVLSTWVNFDGLAHECEKYLNLGDLRDLKATAGSQWVRENHSWRNRVEQLKKIMEKHGKSRTATALP